MAKNKTPFFRCKLANQLKDQPAIAREMAILRMLKGKLPYRIPRLDTWDPVTYMFSYLPLPGVTITKTTANSDRTLKEDVKS
jgi:hypothetical protein